MKKGVRKEEQGWIAFPRFQFHARFRLRKRHNRRKMVLAELGKGLTSALAKLQTTTIIDDAVVASIIKDITNALLHVWIVHRSHA